MLRPQWFLPALFCACYRHGECQVGLKLTGLRSHSQLLIAPESFYLHRTHLLIITILEIKARKLQNVYSM